MRIVSFTLKNSSVPESASRVGALSPDGKHIIDFQAALGSAFTGGGPSSTGLLDWFDLDKEPLQKSLALYAEIVRDASNLNSLNEGGAVIRIDDAQLLAPVPRPGKVICIGLNYRDHAAET